MPSTNRQRSRHILLTAHTHIHTHRARKVFRIGNGSHVAVWPQVFQGKLTARSQLAALPTY